MRLRRSDRSMPSARRDAPRLVRRFALYAGVALVVAAFGAFLFVRRYATQHAEDTAKSHTEYIAEAVLPDELRRSDFRPPLGRRRIAQLDRFARQELLTPGVLRVKLYSLSGEVAYSSDHQLIGTRPGDAGDALEARDGAAVGDVTSLDAEGGTGPNATVLESYAPVRMGGSRPVGVFETYADYAPILSDARGMFVPLALGMALVMLGLYLSFFPILKRVTRTLRRQVSEIEHKAYHDSLTDLPNRTLFQDRAQRAVAEARARGLQLAVMLIDLDRFKDVNDTLGHDSGDRLLKALAEDLPAQMRRADTVARLGGDEFGVLAVEVSGPSAVLALAEKVRRVLAAPRSIDGMELTVDASVGIALFPDHGGDAETLIRRADVAMYRSKETHAPALYDCAYDHHSEDRLTLVAELRRAIAKRELLVMYQPQCEPARGGLEGVETLVRWQHPRRGLLTPDEFVPLAEHSGLIRQLTSYVLDEALRQCRDWQREGRELTVAVNVTGRDLLDAALPGQIESLLRRWKVDPRHLELEISERTALTDLPQARTILDRLSGLGVSLAIDDFGTGSSSLAYFRNLPIDVLKIDRSFVAHMLDDEGDAAIVRSTIELAHDLGLRVIAEGVESAECAEVLAKLGCDLCQGYHFGRPTSAGQISRDFQSAGAIRL